MGNTENILERTEDMLKASYSGLNQYRNSVGEEKHIGLYNGLFCKI